MKVENPAAYRFFLHEDVYLLNADKASLIPSSVKTEAPVADTVPVAEAPKSTISIPEPVIETKKTVINYTGKNLKHFTVVVFYPAHDVMNDTHFAALQSTLGRKGITMDDIALLNINKQDNITIADITTHLAPQKLLVLGRDALPAGLTVPPFNTIQSIEGISILQTFSFGEMMTSNDNKKAFWEQVKNF